MAAVDQALAEQEVYNHLLDPRPAPGSFPQSEITGGQTDHDVQQYFPGSFHVPPFGNHEDSRPISPTHVDAPPLVHGEGNTHPSHLRLPAQYSESPFNNPSDEPASAMYLNPNTQDAVTAQNLENALHNLLTSHSALRIPNIDVPMRDNNAAQCAQMTEGFIDAVAEMFEAFYDKMSTRFPNPTVVNIPPPDANLSPPGPAAFAAPTSSPPPPVAPPALMTTPPKPRKKKAKKTEERSLFLVRPPLRSCYSTHNDYCRRIRQLR